MPQSSGGVSQFSLKPGNIAVVLVSLLTLSVVFLTSSANFSFFTRTTVFSVVLAFYLAFCAGFYFLQKRLKVEDLGEIEDTKDENELFSPEVVKNLAALEETNTYFANSLKNVDVFRLVCNRIGEMIPFAVCLLILKDENSKKLKIVQAKGENADYFLKMDLNESFELVKRSINEGLTQLDEKLSLETDFFQNDFLKNYKSAASFPLVHNDQKVFGAIHILFCKENVFDDKTRLLLDEIGKHVSPLFFNSLTFERNLENSLNDPVTKLPNEKAFFLILENQIAESHRLHGERPLTILCADIQKFDEINKKYGFAEGDRILNLAAVLIKSQLRQMDFLSRSKGDEFLAVLPTASEEITKLIIQRIEKAFLQNKFEISDNREISVRLNFGTATFMKDGETASDLLKKAQLKKYVSKSPNKNGLVLFGDFVS